MGKVLALLIMILSALASATGYILLTEEIRAGEKQMADGQIRLEQGRDTLEEGKVELATGKEKLVVGKKEYEQASDNLLLVLIDKLLHSGKGFKDARKRVAKGTQQVAKGEEKVEVGEDRLAAGELRLSRGSEWIMLARAGRVACAVGAVCFSALSIVFGFRWRRSLAKTFVHTDT